MWIGHWTPWCEDWFQTRLKEIRDGKAELMNATAWRKTLSHYLKKSGKMVKANASISERYLESISSDSSV